MTCECATDENDLPSDVVGSDCDVLRRSLACLLTPFFCVVVCDTSYRTIECTTTKLMHALHLTSDYDEVREIMHTNFVGEINRDYILY